MLAKLLRPVSRARRRLQFTLWVLRSRLNLSRVGMTLEIHAPHDLVLGSPGPVIEPTGQLLEEDGKHGGHVRIEFGAHVNLGRMLVIEVRPGGDSSLVVGDAVSFGTGVRIALFRGDIELGPYSRFRDGVMLKSSGTLRLGSHGMLQNGTMLHCAHEMVLDDYFAIGERVSMLDSDHMPDGSDVFSQQQPLNIAPVLVRKNCWVGANVVILRGARLGQNSAVGAGSVVRGGEYPDGYLVAGIPAKARRPLSG